MKFFVVMLLSFGLSACSTCKCKSIDDKGKVRTPDDPAPVAIDKPAVEAMPSNSSTVTNAASSVATAAPTVPKPPAAPIEQAPFTGNVRVYKYDNSRQCGQGKPTELDEMAKQLKGIKIIAQEKKNDGMMRIQMCGAPTGVANVFEIEAKYLKRAIKSGFREWKY